MKVIPGVQIPLRQVTIGKLKEFLKEFEATWTAEDIKYLGEFDMIPIYVPHFLNSEFCGYGPADMQYDGTLGLIFDESKG